MRGKMGSEWRIEENRGATSLCIKTSLIRFEEIANCAVTILHVSFLNNLMNGGIIQANGYRICLNWSLRIVPGKLD